jgi:NAD(P)-dependent dehydrogenase (short-subunit alcohol dehydrogenase family)
MVLDKFSLKDRVAVVTGGGRGIGYAVAEAFIQAGAKTIIAEVNAGLGEAAVRKLGDRAEFVALDVARSDQVKQVAAEVLQQHGQVDVLVNNAGICLNAGALDTTDDIWHRQLQVNLDGVFFCCREFGRDMVRRRRGSIINLSSIAAVVDVRPQNHIAYSASKAAVAQVSRVLASEWAGSGVRVNAIGPGYVATDMPLAAGPELLDVWKTQIPIGRMIEPDEIASAILFLASDASSAVTGHLLMADGGFTAW